MKETWKATVLGLHQGARGVVNILIRHRADLYAKERVGRATLDVAVGDAKEWARRLKGEAPPPPMGYIEIEPLDGEDGRGGADSNCGFRFGVCLS